MPPIIFMPDGHGFPAHTFDLFRQGLYPVHVIKACYYDIRPCPASVSAAYPPYPFRHGSAVTNASFPSNDMVSSSGMISLMTVAAEMLTTLRIPCLSFPRSNC